MTGGSQREGGHRWAVLRQQALDLLPNECVICGSTEKLQVDHIIPVSVKPELEFDINNLQILCAFHNNSKGNRVEQRIEWFNKRYLDKLV